MATIILRTRDRQTRKSFSVLGSLRLGPEFESLNFGLVSWTRVAVVSSSETFISMKKIDVLWVRTEDA